MSQTLLEALRTVASGRPQNIEPVLLQVFELLGWTTPADDWPELTPTGWQKLRIMEELHGGRSVMGRCLRVEDPAEPPAPGAPAAPDRPH